MFPYPRIVLDTLDDGVKNARARRELRFDQRDDIFAIVGKYPCAVLQAQKTELMHISPEPVADFPPLFRNVEHHEPPPLVPPEGAARAEERALFFKNKHAPTLSGNLHEFSAPSLDESYESLLSKPTCHRLRAIRKLVFVACNTWKSLKYIRGDHGDGKYARDSDCGEYDSLHVLVDSLFLRVFLYYSHIPKLYPTVSNLGIWSCGKFLRKILYLSSLSGEEGCEVGGEVLDGLVEDVEAVDVGGGL